MIKFTHKFGRNLFTVHTPSGEPIVAEYHARAWRQTRFPRYWRELVVAASLSLSGCAGIYVDSGLKYADSGVERYWTHEESSFAVNRFGVYETARREQHGFSHEAENPYASIAVGYEHHFSPAFTASFELAHDSSISTGLDRGVNAASISFRWRPFAGARQ